jgi:sporulation protein YlmC with PRC-barrel domain
MAMGCFIRFFSIMFSLLLSVGIYAQQPSVTTGKLQESGQVTVSLQALMGSKVLDRENKQIGSLKNVMIDVNTGKVSIAEIALGREGFFSKGDERISVPWEQVSVRRQNGSFVLLINVQVPEKIQNQKDK